jgi:zinc protease
MFVAYIATSPEREDEAREGLLEEFGRLREHDVTDEELERARRYLRGMHDIRQERGGAVLSDMVDAWLFGTSLRELEEFDARIAGVTAADVRRLALTHFDPARVVEGVVRGAAVSAVA